MRVEPNDHERFFIAHTLEQRRNPPIPHDRMVAIAKANPELGLVVDERPPSKYFDAGVEEHEGVRYVVIRSEQGLLECSASSPNDEGGWSIRPLALDDIPEAITYGDAS